MSKRNAILAAATRLFARNGFKETSTSELTKITGAAGGTIFHHFKNKEDLFLNVLKDVETTVTSAFRELTERHRAHPGMDQVEHAVISYLQLAANFEDQFLLLHRHYPYQVAETNADCRRSLESVYNCLLEIFEGCIRAGIKDGTIQTGSARSTAMIIFAMVDGITRLHTYNIYHAGSLYNDVIQSCRSLLAASASSGANERTGKEGTWPV
ncbi:MAG TPA: TetR/AcrR family transcriptional regulator [Desulfobacteraceae bacterium]|mgnify:CR=1 FL=1|nr:TetR/AcrR family transcriptional regulator [Desulfobacteraceae bacterium]